MDIPVNRIRGAKYVPVYARLIRQLDTMHAPLTQRLQKRYTLYAMLPADSARRAQAVLREILQLAQASTGKERNDVASLGGIVYAELINRLMEMGEIDHAAALADSGMRAFADIPNERLPLLPELSMLGKMERGPIVASHWFNAPSELTQYQPGRGNVTVVEITSYW
jgi:hypothetical protein